ncbi:expressed unknown protein [Seminavis robusta]|uniref:Uncharacterized protein n=1 Tax=Seminavis robusta TaxID=568900 RepID=A0A9N8H2V0_9STRA|nr:expressed unknown protein [Seminavis robusta]|eukprot:Sro73_g040460.1 n/a (178) ;mRNA; r:94062-94595
MSTIARKVHFGKCSIRSIDCDITDREKFGLWYTACELSIIKTNAHRVARSHLDFGKPAGKNESVRGLERLLVAVDREKMIKRKRNILLSTIELQRLTDASDAKSMHIKNTLGTYVRKHNKLATKRSDSRAHEDFLAATDIYNEMFPVQTRKQTSDYSSLHRGPAPLFKKQSLVAISA